MRGFELGLFSAVGRWLRSFRVRPLKHLVNLKRSAHNVGNVAAFKPSLAREAATNLGGSLSVKIFMGDSLEVFGVNESYERVSAFGTFRVSFQRAGHADHFTLQRAATPGRREMEERSTR